MLVVLVALASPARAGVCSGELGWTADTGTVAPGPRCGTTVLTTDGRSSVGRAVLAGQYRDPTWSLRLRRLGGDDGVIDVVFSHGYVLVRDGAWGVYLSEAQWAASGWHERAGLAPGDGVALTVALRGDQLTVSIDGEVVGTWTVEKRLAEQTLAVWLNGPAGVRTRVMMSDVRVTDSRDD